MNKTVNKRYLTQELSRLESRFAEKDVTYAARCSLAGSIITVKKLLREVGGKE